MCKVLPGQVWDLSLNLQLPDMETQACIPLLGGGGAETGGSQGLEEKSV